MSVLAPLIGVNVRNGYRNKIVVAVTLGFSLFFIALFIVLACVLVLLPQLRSAHPDEDLIAGYITLLAYASGFVAAGMNLIIFTSNILVKEKAQRIHESILAGPVGARELWLAKSLAIYLPGLAFCELAALGTFLGLNALVVAPALGFIASPMMLVNGLALVPVLYFPLTCLVLLVGLCGNPISGNVIANIAFSGLLTLTINLVARAGLDAGSAAFALGHIALAALLGLLVLALAPRLTKERIVLSARG